MSQAKPFPVSVKISEKKKLQNFYWNLLEIFAMLCLELLIGKIINIEHSMIFQIVGNT